MAITVHASAQNDIPGNPIVVALTVSADDVLIAVGEADTAGGGAFSATGFDQLINQVTTTDGSTIGILRKKASTGSDGSISISNTGGNQKVGCAISVTGADNTTPEDVASVVANNNTGQASPWTIAASITPTTNGCLIVAVMNSDSGSGDVAHSFATTSGTTGAWTVHQDVNDGFHNLAIATAEQTTAGAITVTGTGTLASGSAGRSITLIALRPAGAGASAAITGTATASINEDDIVTGGKTIIATLTGDTYVADTVSTTLITHVTTVLQSSVAFTTSFSIQLPVTAANDMMSLEFVHRSTTDGSFYGSGGSSWTLKHTQLFSGASTFGGKLYYKRATGNHSSELVGVSSLVNSCAAMVNVYRGVIATGDPYLSATIVGEQNTVGNEDQLGISTSIAGCMVALVVLNSPDLAVATQSSIAIGPLTERGDMLNTGGTDCSIAHASAIFNGTGDTSTFSWTQTNASSGSFAYALTPVTSNAFAAARQAFIDGCDSAQSEGTGWDAVVKAGQHVSSVVRTSDTVVTMTLKAYGTYNITAQETITVSVPGSILTGGTPVLGSPTFTIDTSGAAAVNRVRFPVQTSGMGVGGMLGGNRLEFSYLLRFCIT